MSNLAINIQDTSANIIPIHPLKNTKFFGVPAHIASIPALTDSAYRLYSILCGSWGNSGHIRYSIEKLKTLMNKSRSGVQRAIKTLRNIGLVITKETGRSMIFILTNNVKIDTPASPEPASNMTHLLGQNRPSTNKDKKTLKKQQQEPPQNAAPDPPPNPPPNPSHNTVVVSPDFSKKVALTLWQSIDEKYRFSITINSLVKLMAESKRSAGQMETIITQLNKRDDIKNPGGYIRTVAFDAVDLLDAETARAEKAAAIVAEREKAENDKRAEIEITRKTAMDAYSRSKDILEEPYDNSDPLLAKINSLSIKNLMKLKSELYKKPERLKNYFDEQSRHDEEFQKIKLWKSMPIEEAIKDIEFRSKVKNELGKL